MGEGDLGNQHQRFATDPQRFAHRAQIDLGLSASGDPVQEKGLGRRLPHGRSDGFQGVRLVRCENDLSFGFQDGLQPPASVALGRRHQAPGGECPLQSRNLGELGLEGGDRRRAVARETAQEIGLTGGSGQLGQRRLQVDRRREPQNADGGLSPRGAAFAYPGRHEPVLLQRPQVCQWHPPAQRRSGARTNRQRFQDLESLSPQRPASKRLTAPRGERESLDPTGCGTRRERRGQGDSDRAQELGGGFA